MRKRPTTTAARLCAWGFLFTVLCGCQSEGSYSIHLVFPSDEARVETARIGLRAANPQEDACLQFQSGGIDAAEARILRGCE